MNYVYYFENLTGKVIYVGKTSNLKRRIKQHFTNGHLPAECYAQIDKIFASEVNNSKYDTEICETLLIDKYKPFFNVDKKFNENANKTNYTLLDLNFRQLYYDFETNKVSFLPVQYRCYTESAINNKCIALIDYNLALLDRRTNFFTQLLYNVTNIDILINDIKSIYIIAKENFSIEYSSLDEPISDHGDLDDTFVAFPISAINDLDIQHENILKIRDCGFIFKVVDGYYGIPLLRPKLLEKINANYIHCGNQLFL